jgi:hypothetical protein
VRTRIWYSPKGKYTIDDIVDFIYNFSINALKGDIKNKKIIKIIKKRV